MIEQKTEVPGLFKTTEGAIINKDNDALQAYKNRRAREIKLQNIEHEISDLKNDLQEIKQLLKGLIK